MEFWAAVLGSNVLVELIKTVWQGLAQRRSARGKKLSDLDKALASRQVWLEHAYQVRRIAAEAGQDLPDFPQDPYQTE